MDAFQSHLTELEPDETYYVRAYATNADMTIYGGQREFSTRGYYPLTITIEGHGEVDQQIIQPKTTEYVYGTIVQLRAVAAPGWVFSKWSGDTTSTEETIVIEVEGKKELKAIFITTPKVSTTSISNITVNSARSGGNVTDDGGATVTNRGVCWSTSQNPTKSNSCTSDGTGTGSFTSNLNNLNPDTRYYVRAYAESSAGIAYGNQRSFITLSGRDNTTTVVDVTNPATGRTWMDRNLGASRAATSMTDSQAYGDLYQWGRAADGHQKRNSPTTSKLSNSDQPGHGNFIIGSNDWRSPRNDNLWQGVNGINNPCPLGYRIPTEAEWNEERQSWSSGNASGAFNSPLKLPVAGYRGASSGSLFSVGSSGLYWSGTVVGSSSRLLLLRSSNAGMYSDYRALGFSIRCLKN